MQRFDWVEEVKSEIEKRIDKLIHEHHAHVLAYFNSPIEEKYPHYTKALRVWKELRNLSATSEAHRRAINLAANMGLVRRGGYPPVTGELSGR